MLIYYIYPLSASKNIIISLKYPSQRKHYLLENYICYSIKCQLIVKNGLVIKIQKEVFKSIIYPSISNFMIKITIWHIVRNLHTKSYLFSHILSFLSVYKQETVNRSVKTLVHEKFISEKFGFTGTEKFRMLDAGLRTFI